MGLLLTGSTLANETTEQAQAAITGHERMLGYWRQIDDRTGYINSIIRLEKNPVNGTYQGRVVRLVNRPGFTHPTICKGCPGEFRNKPLVGMVPIWDAKPNPANPNEIHQGRAMDPLNRKVYSGKARLSADGRRLTMRGYVGVSALGRSQTWIRATDDDIAQLEPQYR